MKKIPLALLAALALASGFAFAEDTIPLPNVPLETKPEAAPPSSPAPAIPAAAPQGEAETGQGAEASQPAAAKPAPPSSDSPAPPESKTLVQELRQGGWVMWPIAFCSLSTVYLVGNGLLSTNRSRVAPRAHAAGVKALFQKGEYVAAYQYCKEHPSPLSNVLRVGVSLLGDGKQAAEEAMAGELAKENGKIQSAISYLSVIGVCTPMIGLLGTVTGMIKAFATLGSSGIGDPSSLASAIGEVLVATASGLFVAIPAFGAFYFLKNRASAAMHGIQDIVHAFFRNMPYDEMAGVRIGDEEIVASSPAWLQTQAASSEI